jgi:hypothetical protein
MRDRENLEFLAQFVHGALAFGHALGFLFNGKKGNGGQALLHLGVCCYDTWACLRHAAIVKRLQSPRMENPEIKPSEFASVKYGSGGSVVPISIRRRRISDIVSAPEAQLKCS